MNSFSFACHSGSKLATYDQLTFICITPYHYISTSIATGLSESTTKFPIFLVGVLLINKSFLTPKFDVLSFGLLKHQMHDL